MRIQDLMETAMKRIKLWGLAGFAAALLTQHVGAQQPASFEVPESGQTLSAQDMRTLVGPVALYPDDLVGIILPASTYPLQIVQASRFLDALETDNTLQPDPDWDDSVVALLNYPEVLRLMDQNIEWTWALGEAVLDEQEAVLDGIQAFRRDALAAGNLASDDQQQVTQNDGLIEIAPANPEVIYIPYYEPASVVVVQPRPVIHYYTSAYPLYYYPYPYGYSFHASYFWGVTTAFSIGWHSHVLHVYDHYHHSHPYYGRVYYSPWYPRYHVRVSPYRNYDVWRPTPRPAARPRRVDTTVRAVASRERQNRPGTLRSGSLAPDARSRSANTLTSTRTSRAPASIQTREQTRERNSSPAARTQTRTGSDRGARPGNAAASRPSGGQGSQRLTPTPRSNAAASSSSPPGQARQNRTGSAQRYGSSATGCE